MYTGDTPKTYNILYRCTCGGIVISHCSSGCLTCRIETLNYPAVNIYHLSFGINYEGVFGDKVEIRQVRRWIMGDFRNTTYEVIKGLKDKRKLNASDTF